MTRFARATLLAALILAPATAFAHPGSGPGHDLAHGFVHPLTGLDHVLAMVGIGLLAARIGGAALWLVPGAFMAAMAGAGVAGASGLPLPHVEIGIAFSVITLGAVIALGVALPIASAMAMAAAFAVFHGYAHGAEMPADMSSFGFGIGFVAATALLHLFGIGLGLVLARAVYSQRIAQITGGAMATVGAGFLIAS